MKEWRSNECNHSRLKGPVNELQQGIAPSLIDSGYLLWILSLLACGGNSAATVANPTLVIADTGNNRILIYNTSVDQIGNPAVVLEEPLHSLSATQIAGRETGSKHTQHPRKCGQRRGWRSLCGGYRKLPCSNLRPPFSNGMKANVVIGQQGFTSANVSDTATGMGSSYSVAIDSKGNLWVSDDTNDRVLEYTPPFSNGMAATLAIGQTSTQAATVCYENPPTANTSVIPRAWPSMRKEIFG